MIKNIFLPEKIGNNYLFAKRIIGIDIGKTHITATKIYAHGTTLTIEECIEEKLEAGTPTTYEERVSKVLKNIVSRLGKFDEVRSALSSSLVVFKELKLPFISYEKINMVINFEVEPLLPFALSDAIVDFIITKQNTEEQSSQVMIAAVQKQHIAQHIQLFIESDINPDIITIDLFALYGLYKQSPTYAQQKGGTVLFNLGLHSTRMEYIHDGQLRLIRTLSKGVSDIVKFVAQELNIAPGQAMDHIIRFGLETTDWPEYTQAIKNACTLFWNKIRFTLTSFTIQAIHEQKINTLLLLGGGAQLKGLAEFVTDLLHIQCKLFQVDDLAQNNIIQFKKKQTFASTCITSLSTALPSDVLELFNVRKDEFSIVDTSLFYKQIITTMILALFLISSLFMHNYWQIGTLEQEIHTSEQEAIAALIERFKKIDEDLDLEDTLKDADSAVIKEEKTWFAFSGPSRSTFLKYLLELTSRIDKQALGFTIEKIIITEGTMVLKAQVKDFKALKLLEKELQQSPLFSHVEKQNDIRFEMKITLAKNSKEA